MTTEPVLIPRAEHLPADSIVVFGNNVWIADGPHPMSPWHDRWGCTHDDQYINDRLRDGATVLRVGDGANDNKGTDHG